MRNADYWKLLIDYGIGPDDYDIEHPENDHRPDIKHTQSFDNILRSIISETKSPQLLDFLLQRGFIDEEWIEGRRVYGSENHRVHLFQNLFNRGDWLLLRFLRHRDYVPDNIYPMFNSVFLYPDTDSDDWRETVRAKIDYLIELDDEYDLVIKGLTPDSAGETARGSHLLLKALVMGSLDGGTIPEMSYGPTRELTEYALSAIDEQFDIRSKEVRASFYRSFSQYTAENGLSVEAHGMVDLLCKHRLFPPSDVLKSMECHRLKAALTERLPERKRKQYELNDRTD